MLMWISQNYREPLSGLKGPAQENNTFIAFAEKPLRKKILSLDPEILHAL